MEVINYSGENVEELVETGFVVVDFFTEWCGPCKLLAPVLKRLAAELTDVKFIKMDRDLYPELVRERYGVSCIPDVQIFKDGVRLDRRVGFIPEEVFRDWILALKK